MATSYLYCEYLHNLKCIIQLLCYSKASIVQSNIGMDCSGNLNPLLIEFSWNYNAYCTKNIISNIVRDSKYSVRIRKVFFIKINIYICR